MITDEEGPVYYREIQKNAYLKRIPEDEGGSKLRPLGHKKTAQQPLWSVLCVHNGRTPYLEQYGSRAAAQAHAPVWRASLARARLVAPSVRGADFVLHAEAGPVRMRAPDWEAMQDWVNTLRETLHELRILPKGENLYCAPPVPAAPRAAARDPTSPLPPTPPAPPHRVPGIEIVPASRPEPPPNATTNPPTQRVPATQPPSQPEPNEVTTTPGTTPVDISDWGTLRQPSLSHVGQPSSSNVGQPSSSNVCQPSSSHVGQPSLSHVGQPSTSNCGPVKKQPSKDKDLHPGPSQDQSHRSLAKICGQNICLDDSIFKRTSDVTDSDEEFFNEIDRLSEAVDKMAAGDDYRQTVVVKENDDSPGDRPTNITVIEVHNKNPPHTAIPVYGCERGPFPFDFAQKRDVVNVVNTNGREQNDYGTVFDVEPKYLSLTTVNLTGAVSAAVSPTAVTLTGAVKMADNAGGLYERLCQASTSTETTSPVAVRKLANWENARKSSLPNLNTSDSTYEYLYPNNRTQPNNYIRLIGGDLDRHINTPSINAVTHTNDTHAANATVGLTSRSTNSPCRNTSTTQSSPRLNLNNTHTINTQSINTHAINTQSINTHAINTQAINTQSINTQSINTQSINTQSINTQSINTQSINTHAINTSAVTHTPSPRIPLDRTNSHSNAVNASYVEMQNSFVVSNTSVIRARVERSDSQSSNDLHRRNFNGQDARRIEEKNDKNGGCNSKPIWRRGLTELSLLTRLRGFGQGKRQVSPNRETEVNDNNTSMVTVRLSRPSTRVDSGRRRSNSFSNGSSPGPHPPGLQSLRCRQAAALRTEQRRGAALVAAVPMRDPPVFADYNKQVWFSWWAVCGPRCGGRAGDRLCAVGGAAPRDAAHAKALLQQARSHTVDVLFHRVPLGKIYVINKREQEGLGIKLDGECNIVSVEADSPAHRAGVPPLGKWALTEVNNRPINLVKGGEVDMQRLSRYGTEVSIIIQPSALVKKLRASLKGNKSLLGLR